MQVSKGTKCVLSEVGHYGFYYMSKNVSQFNTDCAVETKPYINGENRNFIAVKTEAKYIGVLETASESTIPIIVWVESK
jgi:hypothetical protein